MQRLGIVAEVRFLVNFIKTLKAKDYNAYLEYYSNRELCTAPIRRY